MWAVIGWGVLVLAGCLAVCVFAGCCMRAGRGGDRDDGVPEFFRAVGTDI
jgi:hypothetical protein